MDSDDDDLLTERGSPSRCITQLARTRLCIFVSFKELAVTLQECGVAYQPPAILLPDGSLIHICHLVVQAEIFQMEEGFAKAFHVPISTVAFLILEIKFLSNKELMGVTSKYNILFEAIHFVLTFNLWEINKSPIHVTMIKNFAIMKPYLNKSRTSMFHARDTLLAESIMVRIIARGRRLPVEEEIFKIVVHCTNI
ncbi:hypothetical protein T01_1066 [Trichinella spiralis]|uniref:Uncharacterized protein n=1 Tax=Trichinella spiralis TaxID=6334 RepID=A0A0V1B6B4_TRISP|nr:hypothetical protein T01_1066 [Trichinella spiralis]